MIIRNFLWGALLVVILASCGTPKVLTTAKSEAATYEASCNYEQALTAWTAYFNATATEDVTGADFAQAAKTAFKTGNASQAISWFDQARYKNYADAEMYETLARVYQNEGNLSKELSALEYIVENFGNKNTVANARLLAIYNEINEPQKALAAWNNLNSEAKADASNLEQYFFVNKKMDNSAVCDSVASALLNINPENIEALAWNAKKYYWAGQNRYEREMARYNKNKTRKNYSILLKELDLVTADFKKALPYLNTLWKLNPGKEYAGYLANIYARFGDEQKTAFYKNYLK
ncbi:hypothetical protein [uncultured Draconibacterium sp.]|uniref:tetratricopeptide repeat protein n=1 Tax=uncultured Draconibacterium sp. TaxID=1573823 RepID=UPI003261BBBF